MKTLNKLYKLLFILLFTSFICSNALAKLPTSVNGKPLPSLAPMLKQVTPAIVNVSATGDIPIFDLPFRDHKTFPKRNQKNPLLSNKFESVGSGVILDAKHGYIITNAHVVHDTKTITVTLVDGRHFRAKLLGEDVDSDIAVLQIKAKHLHAIQLGNSDKLKVGDFVVAIGNPYGLNQTVTSGIVSALGRTNLGIEGYENFIQTDAAINSGNSGGALVNLKGQLVGINTAILTPDGGSVGIGFAIPIDMAHGVVKQLIKYGKIKRGLLGIMVQSFSPDLAHAFDMPEQPGAIITSVTPDSPAAKAGLKIGDVIVDADSHEIENAADVRNIIGLMRIGDEIKLTLKRNHTKKTITVDIGNPQAIFHKLAAKNPFLTGMSMRNFYQAIPARGLVQGVQLLDISESSPAWAAGLRPGDIIIDADRKPIHDMKQLHQVAHNASRLLLLRILRDRGSLFFVIADTRN